MGCNAFMFLEEVQGTVMMHCLHVSVITVKYGAKPHQCSEFTGEKQQLSPHKEADERNAVT